MKSGGNTVKRLNSGVEIIDYFAGSKEESLSSLRNILSGCVSDGKPSSQKQSPEKEEEAFDLCNLLPFKPGGR